MIPATLHLVWLGQTFPWLNALAIVSAAERGGFERIVLHTDCEPRIVLAHWGLARLAILEIRAIDVAALAQAAGRDVPSVQRLYTAMTGPAARSDVLRALILAAEGGVYLDMDTITIASLSALRASHDAFVGQERICFPTWSTRRPALRELVRAYGLSALRYGFSVIPGGFRGFARLEPHLKLAVNNAVLGCRAHHPFIEAYVSAMLALPLEQAARRYAIGPHLLARVCREFERHAEPVSLLESHVFYPLPPVISEHWWRTTSNPALPEVLSEGTLVVHWYASVRSKKLAQRVDAAYVRSREHRELFSRLAASYLHAC